MNRAVMKRVAMKDTTLVEAAIEIVVIEKCCNGKML